MGLKLSKKYAKKNHDWESSATITSTQTTTTPLSVSNESIPQNDTQAPPIQFKSYFPDINTREEMIEKIGDALIHQQAFDKRTSPWETNDWSHTELKDFQINVECIDRLYHLSTETGIITDFDWDLYCRIDHHGTKYFTHMHASCDYYPHCTSIPPHCSGFYVLDVGRITITKLPDFFLNNIISNHQNLDQIYLALLDDNYAIDKPNPLLEWYPKRWKNTPMLKYLCHMTIFENRKMLINFKDHLPKPLANGVYDFIKVQEWVEGNN